MVEPRLCGRASGGGQLRAARAALARPLGQGPARRGPKVHAHLRALSRLRRQAADQAAAARAGALPRQAAAQYARHDQRAPGPLLRQLCAAPARADAEHRAAAARARDERGHGPGRGVCADDGGRAVVRVAARHRRRVERARGAHAHAPALRALRQAVPRVARQAAGVDAQPLPRRVDGAGRVLPQPRPVEAAARQRAQPEGAGQDRAAVGARRAAARLGLGL